MRPRSVFRAFTAAGLLAAGACSDQNDPATPDTPLDPTPRTARQEPTDDPNALARGVAGFGGFFFDAQGVPTVYLKDPARRGDVEVALAPYFRGRGMGAARVQARRGEYTWSELEEWYGEASTKLLADAGAVYVDADEASNRVRIGVERGAAGRFRTAVARLRAPAAAVVIEETERVRFAVAPKPKGQSLQGVVRPIRGGVQINFPGFLCTLGFNARGSSGTNYFVTNSHCTNVQGGTENTPYWQPLRSTAPQQIATEGLDPLYNLPGCPAGRVCRRSDASRASYAAGFTNLAVGQIAKTNRPGRSLTITGTFNITAEGSATAGDVVNKVGRTTGWSQGSITQTCVNTNVSGSNITQLCQNFVRATVGSGDSGSPVFEIISGTSVRLVGILWGGSGSSLFVYSPLTQVELELGGLTTF